MKEEYLDYAKKIDELGDEIVNTTELTANLNENLVYTKEQLVESQKNVQKAIEDYELVIQELQEIVVPDTISNQHNQLIGGITCFSHGNTLMWESININNGTIDKIKMAQGRALNDIGTDTVNKSSERISNILIKS